MGDEKKAVRRLEGGEVRKVLLCMIRVSPFQVRRTGGTPELAAGLAELAESIRANGLACPLTVRPLDEEEREFELVAGHRRLAALRLAGMVEADCYVRPLTDREAEELLVAENLQRRDLTPVEEAESVARMLAAGRSHEEVAAATGKSVRWVYRRASITSLSPEWQGAAAALKLSAAFLERVGRLPLKIQEDVFASMGGAAAVEGREAFADVDFLRGGDCGELDRHIRSQLREIGKAPWAESALEGLDCSGCADRTDAAGGDLFEEYEGAPRCLNAACWDKRLEEHVASRKAALKKEHAQVIEATGRNASLYAEARSARMSVPVLVTDGPRKGETLWAPGKDENEDGGRKAEAKKPGTKDRARFATVAAVRACLAGAGKPEWQEGDGGAVQVPHAALVAFACGCGVNSYGLVSGAYSGPLPRSLAILGVLSKAGTPDAERAALWLAAKPNVLKALDLDEGDFDASEWETKEAQALKLRDAFLIPQRLVDSFYAEFAPRKSGRKGGAK